MNRILISLIITILCSAEAFCQDGLQIDKIFGGRYHNNPAAAETLIQGNDDLEDKGISLIRTLKLTNVFDEANFIEPLVTADGAKAIEKTVLYKDGLLYLGFYQLPPDGKKNRYLIYLNQKPKGGDKINVIFIEGNASYDTVSKLIKK